MVLTGYSTYSTIFIRASQHPSINENNPDTLKSFLSYMNREQYGSWSIIDRKSTIQRQENSNWKRYTDNRNEISSKEVLSFVWNYQIKEMYLRYFGWQFIGREYHKENFSWTRNITEPLNDINANEKWDPDESYTDISGNEKWDESIQIAEPLANVDWSRYGIPFALIFGIIGCIYHFIIPIIVPPYFTC